eukprot:CAMPEP_0113691790 /NCGR_PEP_ID=MMETSP0038_2-20120614/18682_1 /TAXON_ID=2898 /ORGANISM="Cryptomonas paramecium" /LENGTH=177 /DNA_ID=CAMNT_0000613545 /DNA_START=343 /DNA_END=876 /DNA_ORIENTATION=+ /assembly_acc=CAM_ASM_000170
MVDHATVSTVGVVRDGRIHTLFTAMFSHHTLGHLAANMLTLYFFGGEIVALLGARRFLQLYLGGGLVSSLCQVSWPVIAPQLNIPGKYRNHPAQPSLGASGAVNSVVAFSIMAAPARMIYVYFFLPIPSALLGCLFLGKDLAGLYYGDTSIGNAAHLGGSFYGALAWMMMRRRPFHY